MEDLVNGNPWKGRRVLVTGHTGFKGAWLCHWLLAQSAEVAGYALAPDTDPSLFRLLGLEQRLRHVEADVRDHARLAAEISAFRPEAVLHLAAQPLVRRSYREPRLTWETNVLGTVNLLEAVRVSDSVRACVVVTSDKCYENRERMQGYREEDALGGHDPYSASKGAAEIAVASWRRSYPGQARIASARAGNVIGGGDWSEDRLVSDFVRSLQAGRPIQLRNPQAVRPWQHVLEPLAGYLQLAWRLLQDDGGEVAEAWNFGPTTEGDAVSVAMLARLLVGAWGARSIEVNEHPQDRHEAGLLQLDCSKARLRLGWHGRWDIAETARRTAIWYRDLAAGASAQDLCNADLSAYLAVRPAR
jgi:CDP-glucose 4,6-dehydratase